MDPRDRWQAHQIIHGKHQGTIHHAVDKQFMLIGIDVRGIVTMHRGEVQRIWGNDAHGLVQWREHAFMPAEGPVCLIHIRDTTAVHISGTLAVGKNIQWL
jgi:hypothetical protein